MSLERLYSQHSGARSWDTNGTSQFRNHLQELWRRGRDSNPRYPKGITVFETAAFDHSATSPISSVFVRDGPGTAKCTDFRASVKEKILDDKTLRRAQGDSVLVEWGPPSDPPSSVASTSERSTTKFMRCQASPPDTITRRQKSVTRGRMTPRCILLEWEKGASAVRNTKAYLAHGKTIRQA